MSGGFDSMSGFGQGVDPFGDTAPLSSSTTQPPPSSGSNRDSLNLDDFEKVEADDHMFGGPPSSGVSAAIGNVAESTQATAVGLVDDIMAKVTKSGDDLFSNFTATGLPSASENKVESSSSSDPFKMEDFMSKDYTQSDSVPTSDLTSSATDNTGGLGFDIGFSGIPASESFTSDLLASAPPPPSNNLFDDFSPKPDEKSSSALDDFLSKNDDFGFKASALPDMKGMPDFSLPDVKEAAKDVTEPLFDSFSSFSTQAEPAKRDPSPDFRNITPPRTPTAPLQEFSSPKQPTPPRTPTPPPKERTPSPPPKKEPTPPPREPTPPRTPTPPPKEPTPPPKVPTPPPKVPTPPPREPTPPPREPTPPPREPTPPPREPTPPPREPTPPPREPTPPPKVPTPLLREPTPPREPSPVPRTPTPPPLITKEMPSAPVQEAIVSPGRSYKVSASTEKSFNVFKPRAWFNPDQLDPRVVDLIYWRDVKKSGIVFGSLMVILLSLAYLSLISVVAYTSLALLTGTITFRVYKNIMQAVQKSQDGHPFKSILEMDTDLPSDKVHEATDVIVSQINSTVSELKRLFLVDDLVDSVKFGCLLWCLTYLGSWFNGLTLVILAVVALFSLPKVYEQNQAQIDQYVGLVRSQVNDVMSKVKAALPIGNKEKTQ